MEPTSEGSRYPALWEAALRDAAGVVSSYLTPEAYGVATYSLLGIAGASDFSRQIQARVDLGRAAVFAELLPQVESALTTSYRHEISRSQGVIRGKLHIPRLVTLRARGDYTSIPVIRAERQLETPENLLLSEALRRSQEVCRAWRTTAGREQRVATGLLQRFQAFEARPPWADLRNRPRPSLHELGEIVLGRVLSGMSPPGGIMNRVADLFRADAGTLAAFSHAAGTIAFLAVSDPRFEDRLFELLCLSWILDSLSSALDDVVIDPSRIRSGKAGPVLTGRSGSWTVELSFQSGKGVLPRGRWSYHHSRQPLRAIPDLLIRLSRGGTSRIVLIDAKNRSTASESEVIYKLLGYRENLGLSPYYAIAIYPSLRRSTLHRLSSGDSRVIVLKAGLDTGKRVVARILRPLATNEPAAV